MALPKRKSIRLSEYDYSKNGYYFVTICTQDRKCIFGDIVDNKMVLNNIGNIIEHVLKTLPNRFPIILDAYQIMPNHIHTIINIVEINPVGAHHDAPEMHHDTLKTHFNRAIHESPLHNTPHNTPSKRSLLSQIIGYFKMNSTKQIRHSIDNPKILIWQRNYYEHIIRNDCELNKIRDYIKLNPVGWSRDKDNPISK